jgi:hypothetical protein
LGLKFEKLRGKRYKTIGGVGIGACKLKLFPNFYFDVSFFEDLL